MTGPFFPNPARHALAVLEACDGDLQAAIQLTVGNALGGDLEKDFDYWCDVRNALLPDRAAQC
jgi:hypothetical protein